MNSDNFLKIVFCFSVIIFTISCSSSSEEVRNEVSDAGEPGIDATTRRAQELESERQARVAVAAERMRRSALATRVFYFDFDTAEFRSADRGVLDYHAQDLASNSDKRIRIEGHADERGTREYNLALGERRANNVIDYLIVNGASRNQIEAVSYGEERPADRGESETSYQRNRRVEIILD
ncbi:MAG: peptidoglycan-associated lipoprotein [Rhodospirillaceae bacterium]|nr:peptidoglycan-associated lipoprotein [Rhodospirillaceae bacterium]